ncbi:hypothetical protein OIV83_003926 [Microbotryomycetes sp. JL201]|nr:hypothetical protein OIV83_003926 [Microbotryomycetes sp. JL201]
MSLSDTAQPRASFLQRMIDLLEGRSSTDVREYVHWTDDGSHIWIKDEAEFELHVSRAVFGYKSNLSWYKQMNNWGFRRLVRSAIEEHYGVDTPNGTRVWFHQSLQRGATQDEIDTVKRHQDGQARKRRREAAADERARARSETRARSSTASTTSSCSSSTVATPVSPASADADLLLMFAGERSDLAGARTLHHRLRNESTSLVADHRLHLPPILAPLSVDREWTSASWSDSRLKLPSIHSVHRLGQPSAPASDMVDLGLPQCSFGGPSGAVHSSQTGGSGSGTAIGGADAGASQESERWQPRADLAPSLSEIVEREQVVNATWTSGLKRGPSELFPEGNIDERAQVEM